MCDKVISKDRVGPKHTVMYILYAPFLEQVHSFLYVGLTLTNLVEGGPKKWHNFLYALTLPNIN